MSEFRENLASGDWVIIAPGRAGRPDRFGANKKKQKPAPIATCPFEHPEKSGNWPPIQSYPSDKNWRIIVIHNKYPALVHGKTCSVPFRYGIYHGQSGVGEHELVVTRDHNKNFADLGTRDAEELLRIFQERCRVMAKDKCLNYVVPFFNWGANAGASIWHPHYQIAAGPIVPGHVVRSFSRARAYFKKNHRCVRCDIVKAERAEGRRVVAENKYALAFTPYASKVPFELTILPKAHHSYFHKTSAPVIRDVAALIQSVMKRLRKYANDPDLNFFIHEAPIDGEKHDYHHWHVEILPRVSVPAGFEFSTGVYINTLDPDLAAKILRGEVRAEKQYH